MATTFTDGTDNPAIFPANALKRSPYASPETPAGQAIGRAASAFGQGVANLPSQIAPATTGALRTAGQNISQNLQNGQYGAAAANTIRGAAEASSGLVQDTIGRPIAGVVNSLRNGGGLGAQGVGFTNALLGTNISPPGETLYTPPVFQDTAGMQAALDASKPAAPAAAAAPAVTPPGVGTPGVTSADRVAQMGRDATSLRALSDRSLQNSAQGIGVPGTPGMGVMDAGVADARQKFFDEAALRTAAGQSSWSPRGGYKANDAAIQAAAVPVQNRQRLQELSLKNAGDQSIARMQDSTNRRGQDISADTAAGAQAVTLRGQELTSATARAQGARDQFNKDREFDLNKTKTALDITKEQRTAAAESQKRISDQITSMLPAGPDGKPDLNAHAAALSSVNNAIAQRTQLLQAQVAKGGPNAAGAKAELEALERDPFGALGQDNVRKLAVGNQLTNRINETATGRFNPFGTAASGSTAPVTSLRPDSGLFGTDYVATHADRSTSTIPARKLRDANGNISPDYNLLMVK